MPLLSMLTPVHEEMLQRKQNQAFIFWYVAYILKMLCDVANKL